MSFSWNDYPHEVLRPLVQGSVGRLQLGTIAEIALSLAQKCPQSQVKDLFTLAGQMLLSVWEGDLFNANAAKNILQVHNLSPICSAQMLSFAKLISKSEVPDDVQEYQAILQLEDRSQILPYLELKIKKDPQNLFWIRSAVILAHAEGQCPWLERWLVGNVHIPKPIQQGLLGDVYYALGQYDLAVKYYLNALRLIPSLTWRERLGDVLHKSSKKEEAIQQWRMVLEQRPWHASLQLKLFDIEHGRDLPGEIPEGKGAILLYTWNKAECIDVSLKALANSDFGDARIIVFDNGCTDATPQVLSAWQDRLGERMETFRAPCNIGAPAARNWLLAMPQTQDCEWVAYLDDDAEVPKDWLRLFGTAMKAYPQHPVYGCCVVNHDNAQIVQSADLHILSGGVLGSMRGGENGAEPGHVQRFSISNLQAEGVDYGAFSFLRPCASVTGCCHLFRRKALDSIGHFDLRFSPSQFDDLEHDIRLALQGQWPVYQGHLCVGHMRKSGSAAAVDVVSRMSIWSNLFKLQMKYSHEDYESLRQHEHQLLFNDLLYKVHKS